MASAAAHPVWCRNYNDEWAAFYEENCVAKSRSARDPVEPELLPRVWNMPHG